MKIDLDKTDEQIVNEFDDLKELQELGTRLFLLREASYQRRLQIQVKIDKAKVEQDRIEAEELSKNIIEDQKKKQDTANKMLKDAIINEVQKIMKEGMKE